MLMAVVAFIFLPDSPDKARFLNDQEKLVAKARGVRQVGRATRVGGIVWKDVGAALLDAKCWFTAVRLNRPFTIYSWIDFECCLAYMACLSLSL